MKQCMDSENLHRRLKKIIGQVQAIDRMVDEDVPCEDILAQINPILPDFFFHHASHESAPSFGTQSAVPFKL